MNACSNFKSFKDINFVLEIRTLKFFLNNKICFSLHSVAFFGDVSR